MTIMHAVLEIDELRERIWQLETALRPFAIIADEIEATAKATEVELDAVVGPARWEDCKRARYALAKPTPVK